MRPQAFSAIVLSTGFCAVFAACGGGATSGASSTMPSGVLSADASSDGAPASGASLDASLDATLDGSLPAYDGGTVGQVFGDGGNLCGCKLCAPVVSEDTCASDRDCMPERPCHAEKCVNKVHAVARNPNVMCTEIMMCNTTDANSCGCVKGKCTLSPR